MLDDFDRRHIEELELQFKEIEAIQHYEEVKRGRDDCGKKLRELADIVRRNSVAINEMGDELQSCTEELKKLSDVEEKAIFLQSEIDELGAIRVAVAGNDATTIPIPSGQPTKTIQEILGLALQSKEEEIRRRAAELLNPMKAEWERTEKPRLVSEVAAQQLKQMIETLSATTTNLRGDHLISTSTPAEPSSDLPNDKSQQQPSSEMYEKLVSILDKEVQRKVNLEFTRRVEMKSQEKAEQKLKHLRETEWHEFYNQTIMPKAEELKIKVMNNVFSFLKGPWPITCRVCGTIHQSILLSPEQVESLLSNRNLELQCYGSFLRSQSNWFDNIIGTAHTFRIELLELIQYRLTAEN